MLRAAVAVVTCGWGLTIGAWGNVGDSCANPLIIHLPADLPYVEDHQTTCGRGNHDGAEPVCLGDYIEGEDIYYRLVVTSAVDIEITMDPLGTWFTCIALAPICPPGCSSVAWAAGETVETRLLSCLHLAPGTYTLLVDSALPTTCIPSFYLGISACAPQPGTCCLGTFCSNILSASTCLSEGGQWNPDFDCHTAGCPVTPAPIPDTCGTVYLIPSTPFAAVLNTQAAHAGTPRGDCNSSSASTMQNDVWFKYTAAAAELLTLDTSYAYNGLTVVYSGPNCTQLTPLYCLNAHSNERPDTDSVSYMSVAGETYWFQVGRWGTNPGAGTTRLLLRGPNQICRGDTDCDGAVGFTDIDYFIEALPDNLTAWTALYAARHGGASPTCPFANCDINADGHVGFIDIDGFVARIPSPCP